MEDILDWLQRAEAISNSRRRKILDNETEDGFAPTNDDLVVRLMEELRNGIAMATLATKLDKSIR